MFNVALTGNVASGKSTVVEHFAAWGATVIDADRLVREAQQPGTDTLASIARHFGGEVLKPDGTLDRDALRARVMRDPAAREALNAIVHPVVQRRRDELARAAAARGDLILLNDIPLLFEALDPAAFDFVILVDAPEALRRRRLVEQRGLTADEAQRLIDAQIPSASKRERSDMVLDNAGTLDALRQGAWRAWTQLRARAARAAVPPEAGPLLAIFAHPADAGCLAGGTLARYHDAGLETHLVCAAAAGAVLPAAAAALAVTSHEGWAYPAGRVDPNDDSGPAAVAQALARLQPAVVISFGPDGANGHSDHVAVASWVRRAVAASGAAAPYEVAFPDDSGVALPPGVRTQPRRSLAHIDVRPWLDVKSKAIAGAGEGRAWCLVDGATRWPPLEREWYVAASPLPEPVFDLYQRQAGHG